MVERIRLGHKSGEHGLWVSRPGVDVATADRYTLSSTQDMLKIHFQGHHHSVATHDDSQFWQHEFEYSYPDLGYIPLAFLGVRPAGGVCQFPPDLDDFVHGLSGVGQYMGIIGFSSNKLQVRGWNRAKELHFHFTVFRYKLLDGV